MSLNEVLPAVDGQLDLCWGVGEIGVAIKRSSRQTHYLLSKGALPAKKVGGRWCAPRETLRAFFTSNCSAGAA